MTLNPATSLETVREILPYVDQVLVMTVNPGFGGQSYIPTMTGKVARLAAMIATAALAVEIEVDGGIDAQTTPAVVRAGARVLVAGTAVFGHQGGMAAGIAGPATKCRIKSKQPAMSPAACVDRAGTVSISLLHAS